MPKCVFASDYGRITPIPLSSGLLKASKEKLPEFHYTFDDAKYRFYRRFSLCIKVFAILGLQPPFHRLNSELQLEVENIHQLSRKERLYCISLSDSAHREHIIQDNDLLYYHNSGNTLRIASDCF